MKPRSSISFGVLLCTCFSPLPLIEQPEPAKISMVDDPPEDPDWAKIRSFVEINSDIFYLENIEHLFNVKPISWFIRNNISLCSMPTAPLGQGKVHKPPWEL